MPPEHVYLSCVKVNANISNDDGTSVCRRRPLHGRHRSHDRLPAVSLDEVVLVLHHPVCLHGECSWREGWIDGGMDAGMMMLKNSR